MYDKSNPESIQRMFDSIAVKYDRANALLSLGMHRLWNRQLIHAVLEIPDAKDTTDILDLCCGTGDIALTFLKNSKKKQNYSAHLLDFSSEMLSCARQKAQQYELNDRMKIDYLKADAQAIPLPAQSIDRITIAYGIRNIQHRERCFAEMHRVLRPGGIVGILELTVPQNRVMRFGHQFYLKTALPLLGRLATSNEEAYHYLCRSIQTFVSPEELAHQLKETGFSAPVIRPLMGGIATLIITSSKNET